MSQTCDHQFWRDSNKAKKKKCLAVLHQPTLLMCRANPNIYIFFLFFKINQKNQISSQNYFSQNFKAWNLPPPKKNRQKCIRLKKINPMSQSCRAHLFFGARLIQQNSRFEFFLLAWFFFFSFYDLSKNTRKDMTDTMKHFEQQTSSTLVFCLVSCSSKIKFHILKLWPTQIWKKKKKKKNVKKNRI